LSLPPSLSRPHALSLALPPALLVRSVCLVVSGGVLVAAGVHECRERADSKHCLARYLRGVCVCVCVCVCARARGVRWCVFWRV
jgi:hypothetical protein